MKKIIFSSPRGPLPKSLCYSFPLAPVCGLEILDSLIPPEESEASLYTVACGTEEQRGSNHVTSQGYKNISRESQNHTESQNIWGWKGPLWVSLALEPHRVQTDPKAAPSIRH